MQRKQIQSISFIALFAVMLILMGRLFMPFASILLWSSVFYILVSPLYSGIIRRMNPGKKLYDIKRHFLAGFFSLGTVLIVTGIFVFIGFQLIGQGKIFLDRMRFFVEINPHFFSNTPAGTTITAMVLKISLGTINLSTLNMKAEILSFLSSYSATISILTRSLLKNIGSLLVSLAFIIFVLYFFFVDGSYLAHVFVKAIPIDQKNTKKLLLKFREVTTNLTMGLFLVAFYQAVVAFIIFSIFHIHGALLFSVLLLFSSFIPIVGCALIWLPLGLSVLALQGVVSGITFLALCALFISFLDNFLRPFFLKDRIKIHPLLIFFSILGGIAAFGLNGILLGPIIVILFFTIVDIALEEESNPETPEA
jgi:predicted PurR-regulated permease PerM